MNRRDFLKAATAGTAAATIAMAAPNAVLAEEAAEQIGGKSKFSGVHFTRRIDDDLIYLGVSDRRTALFENVYPIPRGVAYNSYLLLDEKTVLFDTVDRSVSGQFFENLTSALDGRELDYMVVHHMEPDHCAVIPEVLNRYPKAKILCSELAMKMIGQFFEFDAGKHGVVIREGDTLNTGRHTLAFVAAPMVHWPEVMMSFDTATGTLFSADAFGSFGALNGNLYADEVNFETEWLDDARRYYCNIVGKYGPQVLDVLAKAATLEISRVCPLHGPIWRENFPWLLDKYVHWASYEPEDREVAVFYGSIYGGTENAANLLASRLSQLGFRHISVYDVSKTHPSELIAEAFRCSHLVFASVTYNMNIYTPMKNFINDLAAHNLQKRCYSLIENGSWSPVSGRYMQELLDGMTGMTKVGDTVTIRSSTTEDNAAELAALAETIAASLSQTEVPAEEAEESRAVQWKCPVCGYIYEGEEMPADYKCPLCGVAGEQFVRVE